MDRQESSIRLIGESTMTLEEVLEYLQPYIINQAQEIVYQSKSITLDVEDIVQEVLIKFWRILQRNPMHVRYLKAYVKRIIHNEFINAVRQYRPVLPLLIDENGEIERDRFLILTSEGGISDPEQEYERKCTILDYLALVAEAIAHLPQRQQQAMICSLQDRVDDLSQLIEVFRLHNLHVEMFDWPTNQAEVRSLRSSISIARRAIVQYMKAREKSS